MTIDQAKKELMKRYSYLYENALYILAPYIKEEIWKPIDEISRVQRSLIYLELPEPIMAMLESFFFFEKPMEEDALYKLVTQCKKNKAFLRKVEKGYLLAEKFNQKSALLKMKLDFGTILSITRDYLEEQKGDVSNKLSKLRVLEEYERLYGYQNDEHVKYRCVAHFSSLFSNLFYLKTGPSRTIEDIGAKDNKRLKLLEKARIVYCYPGNDSAFLENEQQKAYLEHHDELPWNLEISCALEELPEDRTLDTRLVRLSATGPCHRSFYIKEEDIFVDPLRTTYRYYQLCPHCGYMVNIPEEILSAGIKDRIERRCQASENLFDHKMLYSGLQCVKELKKIERKKK